MSDHDNNDGMIEVPQNQREAFQVRFPYNAVELLEREKFNTYGINIDQNYHDMFYIFKVPLKPNVYWPNGHFPSFFSQDSDQLRQFRENISGMYHAIQEEGRGQPPMEFYNRNRFPNITLLKIAPINSPGTEVSLIPGKLEEAEALILAIPERIIVISESEHRDRNKKQYGFAPRYRDTMQVLVDCNFFKLYDKDDKDGFTRTHNLREEDDINRESRERAFTRGTGIRENVDYRGVTRLSNGSPSKFRGMQFVYNVSTGELVIDKLNKGTFDFKPPDNDPLGHLIDDIYPWFEWGNMLADDEGIYMPQETEDEIKLTGDLYEGKPIPPSVKDHIYSLFPERNLKI